MIDFSAIPSGSRVGRLLRGVLRVLPLPRQVRILQGPLRGARWMRASSVNGTWLGSVEGPEIAEMVSSVRRDAVFFDVGAHVGYYTLLAARLVGPHGTVVAFEPDARNLAYLRVHLDLNGARNVRVIGAAVTAATGTVKLAPGNEGSSSRVGTDGTVEVEGYSLDDAIATLGLKEPDYIKIDAESAEEDVLRGAELTLRRKRPVIFLSTHTPALRSSCTTLLERWGYSVTQISSLSPIHHDLLACPISLRQRPEPQRSAVVPASSAAAIEPRLNSSSIKAPPRQ